MFSSIIVIVGIIIISIILIVGASVGGIINE